MTKDELSGVAGIHEWARRVRESRQDDGWDIHSAITREGLGVSEYVLVSDRPDPALANTWTKARQMRSLKTIGGTATIKARTLEFLKAIYPRGADNDQLAHVALSVDNAERALKDLTTEGWVVADWTTGNPPVVTGRKLASLDRVSANDNP